jgi:hypothetical protein
LFRARAQLRRHLTAQIGIEAPAAFQFHATRCDRVVKHVMDRIAALRAG